MTNHLTSILLSTENAAIYPLTFLIDSGSELNLIKSNKLTNKVKISSGQVHSFSGIISLGTCKLSLHREKNIVKYRQLVFYVWGKLIYSYYHKHEVESNKL